MRINEALHAAGTLPRAGLSIALVATFLAGCAEPTYPPSTRRRSNPSCHALPRPEPHERLRLMRAFEGVLSGADARAVTDLAQHPTDDSVFFLSTLGGRLLRIDESSARVVYDVSGQADFSAGENGLASIELSPHFDDNGEAYIVYTAPSDTAAYASRIARIHWDGAMFADEETVLDVDQHRGSHSGNQVEFGPDGYLYYAIGDDQRTDLNATPHNLPGSILRVDVEGQQTYAIPPDNPFADGVDAAPEVYAYGFRNPWRLVFEADGTMLVGDVGQDSREEISAVVRGGNYGWPTREGTLCFRGEPPCESPALIDPIAEVTHAEARSIVAGPRFQGRTLFADFNSGTIFSFDEAHPGDVRVEIEGRFPIVSFARDRDGTIYALRFEPGGDQGGVYRLELAPPRAPSTFPRLLSETGCMDPDDPALPGPGLFPFTPEAELWSDGSEKARWLAIPDDRRISVQADGDFELPIGSVLVKHFGFEGRLHETRLLMRTEEGLDGYSYRWNDEQTDAELLEGAFAEVLPHSGVRWQYPRRSQCAECHTQAAGLSLGLEVRQLDDDQLAALLDEDYFVPGTELEPLREGRPLLAAPSGAAPVADRARAYLHANCSFCHRPGGPGRGDIDLRASVAFHEVGVCDATPSARIWTLPWEAQRLLAPGAPELSTLYARAASLDFFRMPPLASGVVDEQGTGLLAEWIRSIETCE